MSNLEITEEVGSNAKLFLRMGVEHADRTSKELSFDAEDELKTWLENGLEKLSHIEGFDFQWVYFKRIIEVIVISIVDIAIIDAIEQKNEMIEAENLRSATETYDEFWPNIIRFLRRRFSKKKKEKFQNRSEKSDSELSGFYQNE